MRKNRGFSQETLAKGAQVDWTFIGRIERGEANPSLNVIAGISNALNVDIADLFPFLTGKKKAYKCDEGTLELLSSVFREIKKFSEERKK